MLAKFRVPVPDIRLFNSLVNFRHQPWLVATWIFLGRVEGFIHKAAQNDRRITAVRRLTAGRIDAQRRQHVFDEFRLIAQWCAAPQQNIEHVATVFRTVA
ncbi:hypothetical protein D3C80_1962870 [compost metagenome]